MTKVEILEMIGILKEMGATSVEVEGVKVEFSTTPKKGDITPQKEDIKPEDLVAPPSHLDQLSDEEVLFWSSDYGLELERLKQQEVQDNEQRKREDQERFSS